MAPTIPATMTVTIAMTDEVRALFDGVTEFHAEIAQELRHLADEIGVADRIVGRLWPTTADWEDRLRALADRIDPPDGGGDG